MYVYTYNTYIYIQIIHIYICIYIYIYTYIHTNIYIYIYIYIYTDKYGPGLVRSHAMTYFLVSLLTSLPPQWILGAHNGPPNRGTCLPRATLKLTKTITGALPNRPDQISNLSSSILAI